MVGKAGRAKESGDDKTLFAFLATFLSIIGFIIALIAKREDKYVMFYAKQSLIVFIIALIAGIVQGFFVIIPVVGWFINFGLGVIVLVLWILSWINSLSGSQKEVPVVGIYARKIKI